MPEETHSEAPVEVEAPAQETETTEPIQETGTEVPSDSEVTNPDEAVAQGESAEEESDYLPDEQQKIFPDEELINFSNKRYRSGLTQEQLDANPWLRLQLKDQLNAAIEIKRLQQAGEEPNPADEEPTSVEEQPTTAAPLTSEQVTQYFDTVRNYALERTQPLERETIAKQFMRAAGYNPDKPYNPKDGSTVHPERIKALGEFFAMAGAAMGNMWGSDPQNAAFLIEQHQQTVKRQMKALEAAWSPVAKGTELPVFASPEFKTLVANFKRDNDWWEDVEWKSPKAMAAALRQYARGQKVTKPAEVVKAYQKGVQKGEQVKRNAAAANLGAGKTAGKFAPTKTGNEDIFGEGSKEYNQRHGRI